MRVFPTFLLLCLVAPRLAGAEQVTTIRSNGSSANRIDLVILGDGYTAAEIASGKYAADVENVVGLMFAQEPYLEYQTYFNVHRIDVISAESGADHSNRNPQVFRSTALDAMYNCGQIQRLICVDVSKVNAVLSASVQPTQRDMVLVLVNDPEYGGSGGAVAVASLEASVVELVLHEAGHSFALLADEYDYSPPACNNTFEPAAVNATIQTSRAAIKWNAWIEPSTPVPTTVAGGPGLYVGANYCTTGAYRPTFDSKMRSLNRPFEAINTEQHVKRMYNWVPPIESSSPSGTNVTLAEGSQVFSVTVPVPRTHSLDVTWTLDGLPAGSGTQVTMNGATLSAGSHQLVATVQDPTPWVRNDPARVLRATRTWNIEAASPVSLGASSLLFGATKNGVGGELLNLTPEQPVSVSFRTLGAAWTATASQPWVQITNPSSGGSGQFAVGIINPGNVLGASQDVTASVTVTVPSLNIAIAIPIRLIVRLTPTLGTPPFGSVDTPTNGASNVSGAIPVSGWALDDIAVAKVQLWRNCVEAINRPAGACAPSVPGGPDTFVFIGDAAFLAGARPDVEVVNSGRPQAYRAGWGYLMSTNALPHIPGNRAAGGQGVFTLTAYAVDVEGQFGLLGTKTISVNNDEAIVPFGSLDTPAQGGVITTTVSASFGWAMTQNTKCIDATSTASYRVYIDGVSRPLTPGVNWFSGLTRPDIAAAYPGLCNTDNALAAYYIDTNALGLANGLHTTGWDVIDDKGNVAGIGSRFFNVLIGAGGAGMAGGPGGVVGSGFSRSGGVVGSGFSRIAAADSSEIRLKPDPTNDRPVALGNLRSLGLFAPTQRTLRVQLGPDTAPVQPLTPNSRGEHHLRFGMGSRIVLDLDGGVEAGYQVVGDELRALPPGSTLDTASGMFAWQPPVPFLGPFHLVFTSGAERIDVQATIVNPAAHASVAMHIDLPAPDSQSGASFIVAGWALDPLAATGSGIDTLHVWAHRRDAVAAPQFLGAAAVGGLRPDVGAAFGAQFDRAGFTLTTPSLAPGVYDLLVYPWSHRTGHFEPAQTIHVVVH